MTCSSPVQRPEVRLHPLCVIFEDHLMDCACTCALLTDSARASLVYVYAPPHTHLQLLGKISPCPRKCVWQVCLGHGGGQTMTWMSDLRSSFCCFQHQPNSLAMSQACVDAFHWGTSTTNRGACGRALGFGVSSFP